MQSRDDDTNQTYLKARKKMKGLKKKTALP